MVFFFDFNGAAVCKETAGEIGEKRPFARAGYLPTTAAPGWSGPASTRPSASTSRPG